MKTKPKGRRRPGLLKQKDLKPNKRDIIAYDIETTPIKGGTPKPLYITAHGAEGPLLSQKVATPEDVAAALQSILEGRERAIFAAWNANKFDLYFVLDALSKLPEYVIQPLVSRSEIRAAIVKKGKSSWTFCDGITMTGFRGTLEKFCRTFGGNQKYVFPDQGHRFNPDDPQHIEYAEQDSKILWSALDHCNSLLENQIGASLGTTISRLGVRFLRSKMPEGKWCRTPPPQTRKAIMDYTYRGGFVWCDRRYWGPAYHYDINQAYAAALRDCDLPCGRIAKTSIFKRGQKGIYNVTGEFTGQTRVPFYYTGTSEQNRHSSVYSVSGIKAGWVTSDELAHLEKHGFLYRIHYGWFWTDTFRYSEPIQTLERIRRMDAGGPRGAMGSMAKALGNGSYGKFCQRPNTADYAIAQRCPGKGWIKADPFDPEKQNLWLKTNKEGAERFNDFCQPQLSTFVSAYVRCQLRDACIEAGDTFLYCDTDSIITSKPATFLERDALAYGKWKTESEGDEYIIVGRRVYANLSKGTPHTTAIYGVTMDEIKAWWQHQPPVKSLLTRKSAIKALFGADLFEEIQRQGIDFLSLDNGIELQEGRFVAIL